MYKGTIVNDITVTANTNIPFTTKLNTNGNTSYDATNNVINILNSGLYNVDLMVNMTDVAVGDVSIQLVGDGVVIPETVLTATSGSVTDALNFSVHDTIRVSPTVANTFATIGVQATVGGTISNAILTVEKVR